MPRIAISYRREDSGVITGRIFDRLVAQYGRDAIFRDIDDVPFGVDFREHIGDVLDHCDIVLAIVGPRWLGPRGTQNRLGDEADPVRVEIDAVLRKGVPVIPVLVLRASMPRVSQLPEALADFAYRNAVQVDAGQDFDVHMLRLIRAMDGILTRKASGDAGSDIAASEATEGTLPEPEAAPGGSQAAVGGIASDRESAPVAAAPPRPAMAEKRRSWLFPVLLIAGVGLGAAAGFAGAAWFRSPAPAALHQDSAAIQAAERRAGELATELATARQKQSAAETMAAAARKQMSEQAARADDLQGRLDKSEQALTAERQANAKALANAEVLNGQLNTLRQQLAAVHAAPPVPPPANPAAVKPPSPEGEANWSLEQRREVQQALRALGYFQGKADGGFGAGTRAAIEEFQAFEGKRETGALAEAERLKLIEAAQRLDVLLDQPRVSPEHVEASIVPGVDARYARAVAAETGKGANQDMAEAAYWYALASAAGDARALANLGTLMARGQGFAKPDPAGAIVLWQAAAARGNPVAMFNLGALYERGIGTAVDKPRARAWYERAAAHNHPDAAAALKRLGT